ncbi:MAG TPA: cysteine-rich CWC family protein [Pseudolabrys sp.]|jgi:hypothetical protein|nr:cysteine-rich CWC family protein [Pseudolabrys sp.]
MTTATASTPRRLSCARCGVAFECGLNADCWCATEPYKLPMTKAGIEDCLCPTCLRKAAASLAENVRAAGQNR